MSNTNHDPFTSIDTESLAQVSGGAARVASGSSGSDVNDQLMMMLTDISNSIKDLANNNNGGMDQMTQMMMMMMMMGGLGGGGAAVAAPQPPQYIDVNAGGHKGW